jgi:hypothetical protein
MEDILYMHFLMPYGIFFVFFIFGSGRGGGVSTHNGIHVSNKLRNRQIRVKIAMGLIQGSTPVESAIIESFTLI